MTQLPEKVVEMIGKLSQQTGTPHDYETLNIIVQNLSQDDLGIALSQHNLLNIFGHMDLVNGVISELALSIATVIFSTFHLTEFAISHETELLLAISSKNYALRDFIISRLTEGIKNCSSNDLEIPEKLLEEIVKIAVQDDIHLASSSLSLVKTFGVHHPQGVKIFLHTPLFRNYFLTANIEEHIIRISELFIGIAFDKPSTFSEMVSSSVFEPLLGVFSNDDPLLQLNCIAVLKQFSEFKEGREFLLSKGTVSVLLTTLESMKTNPLCDILLPGYLTFFGGMAASNPAHFLGTATEPARLTRCLASAIDNPNPAIILCAIETLGFVCRTSEGKLAIAPHLESNKLLTPGLQKMKRLLYNSTTEVLPRVILSFADFLRLSRTSEIYDLLPIAQLTWDWLGRIQAPASQAQIISRIWELARQPFHDVRLAAFNTLEAMATAPWGIAIFNGQPGFVEYLLNRGTEVGTATDNPGLQPAKYAVISQCQQTQERWLGTQSQWSMFDEETYNRLNTYIKEGIWGSVRAEAVVAMEQG